MCYIKTIDTLVSRGVPINFPVTFNDSYVIVISENARPSADTKRRYNALTSNGIAVQMPNDPEFKVLAERAAVARKDELERAARKEELEAERAAKKEELEAERAAIAKKEEAERAGRKRRSRYLVNAFERFAESNRWSRDNWSTSLCALLTGRALDCYGRLSSEQAQDYDKVKQALMKRYDLTEDRYPRKFRSCKPAEDNTALLAEKAVINLRTPFLSGKVKALCIPDAICDVIVGNVDGARSPEDPDMSVMRVANDIVGPINPPSEAGHRFILTLIDYATRYAEAVPLRKIDTETVADALRNIYSRLGVPEEVLSDQGTQFMSDCMKEVCRLLGIKQKATTPYHPMCNGIVERFDATLKTCLRRLCSEQPRQWHRYINPLLFAYREVPQESTHFAPFELLYGRTVRGPMHILRELWTKDIEEPEVKTSYEYVLNLRERLDDTLQIAGEELEKAQGRQKHYYDRTAKCRKFSVGEKVLVLLLTDSNKLLMQWKGPFEVVATVGVSDYQINMGGKVKTFHGKCVALVLVVEDMGSRGSNKS
ncbi:zinc finger protein [Elysia marginata]|uniref:Zinc finger protein n=1 Tax=Elysia marginata TaxID=1093978 RepID=A0AAV4IXL3_9GAST|nr:zinc finger protein [Elysia marginata]